MRHYRLTVTIDFQAATALAARRLRRHVMLVAKPLFGLTGHRDTKEVRAHLEDRGPVDTGPAILPGIREKVEEAHRTGAEVYVRWWNRFHHGKVEVVDDEGFRIVAYDEWGEYGDGAFCTWWGTVAVTDTYDDLPGERAWEKVWPE